MVGDEGGEGVEGGDVVGIGEESYGQVAAVAPSLGPEGEGQAGKVGLFEEGHYCHGLIDGGVAVVAAEIETEVARMGITDTSGFLAVAERTGPFCGEGIVGGGHILETVAVTAGGGMVEGGEGKTCVVADCRSYGTEGRDVGIVTESRREGVDSEGEGAGIDGVLGTGAADEACGTPLDVGSAIVAAEAGPFECGTVRGDAENLLLVDGGIADNEVVDIAGVAAAVAVVIEPAQGNVAARTGITRQVAGVETPCVVGGGDGLHGNECGLVVGVVENTYLQIAVAVAVGTIGVERDGEAAHTVHVEHRQGCCRVTVAEGAVGIEAEGARAAVCHAVVHHTRLGTVNRGACPSHRRCAMGDSFKVDTIRE